MLPQEGAWLHGILHASRQWLGEVSQSSEILPKAFPQIPFSAMYDGETIPDRMRDYESEEDNPMDEEPPHAGSDLLLHYSEEEWVRYIHELEKATFPEETLKTSTHLES